mmetsp:Transcript_9790/g.26015  ORF Transcript_9790/g.26015 Transcript_9790/m.26015 type:complete len:216 (+) Transcript_9790:1444-2091(+)
MNQQRRPAGSSERATARMRALIFTAVSACPLMWTRRSSRRRASCCEAAGGTRFCSRHSQGTSSATNGAYASRRLVLSAGCSRITLYVNLCRSSCSRWIRSWIASRAALIACFSARSSGAEYCHQRALRASARASARRVNGASDGSARSLPWSVATAVMNVPPRSRSGSSTPLAIGRMMRFVTSGIILSAKAAASPTPPLGNRVVASSPRPSTNSG